MDQWPQNNTVVSFSLDMLNVNYLIRQKLSLEKQKVNFPTMLSTILGQIKLDINVAWLSWSSRHKFQSCQNQAEYNLEFQGSVRNLQKRTLFMKFYPEMPWNNTEMCYNNTTFGTRGTFCQILQRPVSGYRMLIFSGLFLVKCYGSFLLKFLTLLNWPKSHKIKYFGSLFIEIVTN